MYTIDQAVGKVAEDQAADHKAGLPMAANWFQFDPDFAAAHLEARQQEGHHGKRKFHQLLIYADLSL